MPLRNLRKPSEIFSTAKHKLRKPVKEGRTRSDRRQVYGKIQDTGSRWISPKKQQAFKPAEKISRIPRQRGCKEDMRNLLKTMYDRLSRGEDLVLVTVIASSGSTPRGAGSRMLIAGEGRICGTIGGGAVEYRSEHIAAEVLKNKSSAEYDFSLTKDDVQKLGMICGGAVNVFFRYIPGGDQQMLALCQKAEELFASEEDMWILYDIGKGGAAGLYTKAGGYYGTDAPDWLQGYLTRHPVRVREEGRDIYAEQINSSGRVYIFGGGHVAQELVPVLTHVGFRCAVMDDREEFATRALFPDAVSVICGDFEHISDYIRITAEDYCCIMTRGHAFDAVIQGQVLKTPACYVGVIGSAHKKEGVCRRLVEEFGVDERELDRIVSPIGLSIKAETPAEIAVSIAGQLIELRAGRNGSRK